MDTWRWGALAGATLIVQANLASAQSTTGPENARPARVAWISNAVKRCPDVRVAADGAPAVVVFMVGRTGAPSKATIQSSSHSNDLDNAAVSCVLKLRFDPAIRLGDGEPIDSWQKIGFQWASRESTASPQVATPQATAVQDDRVSTAAAAAPKESIAGHAQSAVHRKDSRVAVRVCADEAGKLAQDPTVLQSSGNPGFDEAALKIARSGSPYYRPGTTSDGKPLSGCAQLMIEFEPK